MVKMLAMGIVLYVVNFSKKILVASEILRILLG